MVEQRGRRTEWLATIAAAALWVAATPALAQTTALPTPADIAQASGQNGALTPYDKEVLRGTLTLADYQKLVDLRDTLVAQANDQAERSVAHNGVVTGQAMDAIVNHSGEMTDAVKTGNASGFIDQVTGMMRANVNDVSVPVNTEATILIGQYVDIATALIQARSEMPGSDPTRTKAALDAVAQMQRQVDKNLYLDRTALEKTDAALANMSPADRDKLVATADAALKNGGLSIGANGQVVSNTAKISQAAKQSGLTPKVASNGSVRGDYSASSPPGAAADPDDGVPTIAEHIDTSTGVETVTLSGFPPREDGTSVNGSYSVYNPAYMTTPAGAPGYYSARQAGAPSGYDSPVPTSPPQQGGASPQSAGGSSDGLNALTESGGAGPAGSGAGGSDGGGIDRQNIVAAAMAGTIKPDVTGTPYGISLQAIYNGYVVRPENGSSVTLVTSTQVATPSPVMISPSTQAVVPTNQLVTPSPLADMPGAQIRVPSAQANMPSTLANMPSPVMGPGTNQGPLPSLCGW